MREQILEMLYNNSKLSAEEMAVMLGYSAEEIREEISASNRIY